MFIMMNAARLAVGMQGVAVAERATQRALAYAKERRQGRAARQGPAEMAPIIEHADIRRTLMTMKALTAGRARHLPRHGAGDGRRAPRQDAGERAAAHSRVALLTPVAKAFSTDIGCEVASIGVQVHGGMGFIEETGAAQIYRDARILPIYEGTNGIQAIDLVARKLPLEGGKVVVDLHRRARAAPSSEVRASNRPEFGRMGERLGEAVAALAEATAGWAAPCEEPRRGARRRRAVSAAVRPRRRRHLPRPRRAGRSSGARAAERHRLCPLLRREYRCHGPWIGGGHYVRGRCHPRRRAASAGWLMQLIAGSGQHDVCLD